MVGFNLIRNWTQYSSDSHSALIRSGLSVALAALVLTSMLVAPASAAAEGDIPQENLSSIDSPDVLLSGDFVVITLGGDSGTMASGEFVLITLDGLR